MGAPSQGRPFHVSYVTPRLYDLSERVLRPLALSRDPLPAEQPCGAEPYRAVPRASPKQHGCSASGARAGGAVAHYCSELRPSAAVAALPHQQ